MKTLCTQGFMRWVTGERKLTLSTAMVTTTDAVTSIMVKRRYFPRRGTVSEVGGMISARRRKNTVNDRRIDIHRDTWQQDKVSKILNIDQSSCKISNVTSAALVFKVLRTTRSTYFNIQYLKASQHLGEILQSLRNLYSIFQDSKPF